MPSRPGPVESGAIYRAITGHWPRIAGSLVLIAGIAEVVLGRNQPGLTLGFYVFAWATTTGGLWFLFDAAEKAMSDEARGAVAKKLTTADPGARIRAVPGHFAALFDRVFGERHLSWRCAASAGLASVSTVTLVAAGLLAVRSEEISLAAAADPDGVLHYWEAMLLSAYVWSFLLNVIPDYVSLLETRWAIGRMSEGGVLRWLAGDLVLTALISVLVVVIGAEALAVDYDSPVGLIRDAVTFGSAHSTVGPAGILGVDPTVPVDFNLLSAFFYSGFFTSAWLWLYAVSVAVSHSLLRMNAGVGFLLSVTDVRRQPFRSLGFVSVIVVSALFLVALPLFLI